MECIRSVDVSSALMSTKRAAGEVEREQAKPKEMDGMNQATTTLPLCTRHQ